MLLQVSLWSMSIKPLDRITIHSWLNTFSCEKLACSTTLPHGAYCHSVYVLLARVKVGILE